MGTHKSLNISVNNLHFMKVERYVCSLTMIPHQASLSEWFVLVQRPLLTWGCLLLINRSVCVFLCMCVYVLLIMSNVLGLH